LIASPLGAILCSSFSGFCSPVVGFFGFIAFRAVRRDAHSLQTIRPWELAI
jgi:hypothetical protein